MGNTQAKDNTSNNNANLQTPIRKEKKKQTEYALSPALARAVAASFVDPRSPGSRRTPVHSPMSTPPLTHRPYRERVLERVASGSKFDPRSPSAQRTPLHLTKDTSSKVPPSPFALAASFGDPRSPYVMRTPLALSAQDAIIVPDDFGVEGEKLVVAEVIVEKSVESIATPAEKDEGVKAAPPTASSEANESTSIGGFITEKFSPDSVSPSAALIALASSGASPMYSPAVTRKRKDLLKAQASLSPLKKSFSAPMDENAPPSPLLAKSANHLLTKPRTPLSPLSCRTMNTNANIRHSICMGGVQPIKFRMDPGILG